MDEDDSGDEGDEGGGKASLKDMAGQIDMKEVESVLRVSRPAAPPSAFALADDVPRIISHPHSKTGGTRSGTTCRRSARDGSGCVAAPLSSPT